MTCDNDTQITTRGKYYVVRRNNKATGAGTYLDTAISVPEMYHLAGTIAQALDLNVPRSLYVLLYKHAPVAEGLANSVKESCIYIYIYIYIYINFMGCE
jgi:hypothetical protein